MLLAAGRGADHLEGWGGWTAAAERAGAHPDYVGSVVNNADIKLPWGSGYREEWTGL